MFASRENPIQQVNDPAQAHVSGRHRPFMGRANRQRPIRRSVHVKTARRVPRPMDDEQIGKLLASLRLKRDKALLLLMLHGGLRPGEVLNIQLEDISYARRRVIIRYRTDHPKGARTKSRTERVVDLLEAETLQAVSDYVMHERPRDATSPYVFLVGGRGKRRDEPLSYAALVKPFERHCGRKLSSLCCLFLKPKKMPKSHQQRIAPKLPTVPPAFTPSENPPTAATTKLINTPANRPTGKAPASPKPMPVRSLLRRDKRVEAPCARP